MLHPSYHSDGIVPESHRLPFSSGKRPNLFSAAKRPTLWTFHYYRITYLSCQQNNDRIKYIFCLKMLKPRKQTPTIWKSPDFSCTGKTTGLDGRFAPGKAYGCHQFLNWWPQDATGFLHLDGFESRSLHQIKKATPSGGIFISRKSRDSNPLKCDMPVAYRNSQFKNWLSPYEFAPKAKSAIESRSLHETKEIRTFSWLGMGSDFLFLSKK